jgi:hypothetical protein
VTAFHLVQTDALVGVRVGLSVSDSADLARLGLSPKHAELAVGELARAVLVAGGTLVYGGRISPSGYTQFLMHEVQRYGTDGRLVLCLAEHEHAKLSWAELDEVDRSLGPLGQVICLDRAGAEIPDILDTKDNDPVPVDDAEDRRVGYSALRTYMTGVAHARVVIGGQLSGFGGPMPGIIEEAGLALEQGQPVYVSAGFGGAAALTASALGLEGIDWMPDGFPLLADAVDPTPWTDHVKRCAADGKWTPDLDGLESAERASLTATYRAGEVAAYVVRGLSRVADRLRDS